MKTVMYIHGYGSDGNAKKGQLLRAMLPDCHVVSPTFDYDNRSPWQIQEQISEVVKSENVELIVGSSFGGYQTLCATSFFTGKVWVVNPVHDVETVIRRIIVKDGTDIEKTERFLADYSDFNKKVFERQSQLNQSGMWPEKTELNFALSTDDELLGDHKPLLELFPRHNHVVWKDNCGHRFYRFEELDILG